MNIISGLDHDPFMGYTLHCLQKNNNRDDILHLIKTLDTGISDLKVESPRISLDTLPENMPEAIRQELLKFKDAEAMSVFTLHQRYSADGIPTEIERFVLSQHESKGTQKLVALSGLLFDTLKNGCILIVDEFDARFHPLIPSSGKEL